MSKKTRSAMGVEVDFDAIKIKQQLATTPQPTKVKAREQLVEDRSNKRAQRRAANKAKQIAEQLNKDSTIIQSDNVTDENFDNPNELEDESNKSELNVTDTPSSTTRKQQKPKS